MSHVIFKYHETDIPITFNGDEPFSIVIQKFCFRTNTDKKDIYFLNNGTPIKEGITLDKIPMNNQNIRIINVFDVEAEPPKTEEIIKSENIICPECKENAIISLKGCRIYIECKNGHKRNNLSFKQFNDSQNEDISKIICKLCNKSKLITIDNKMFFCFKCNANICPNCKFNHDMTHKLVNYEGKNFICHKHGEYFNMYCKTCKQNVCPNCESEHYNNNHEIMILEDLIVDKNELKEQFDKTEKNINKFKIIVNEYIQKLFKIVDNIDIYQDINKKLCNSINRKYKTSEELISINGINNNNKINIDINNIINDNNINSQITNILDMYKALENGIDINNGNNNNENNNFNIINEGIINNDNNNNNIINNEDFNAMSNNNLINNALQINNNNNNNNNNPINNYNDILAYSSVRNALNAQQENNIRLEEEQNSPLISKKLDINILLDDYKDNIEYLPSVNEITEKYKYIKKIRRDGNCFHRGFIYRLFEYICNNKNDALYEKIIKKIEEAKELCQKNDNIKSLIDDPYNAFIGQFCSCYNALINNISSRDYLDNLFMDNDKKDMCSLLILFVRYSIAAYLLENKQLYEGYIQGDYYNWIVNEVEPIDKEVEHVQIMACVKIFDVGIKIECLNSIKNNELKFPEDIDENNIFIKFLFRPGHYDLLYKYEDI